MPKLIPCLCLAASLAWSAERGGEIKLWPNGAPGSEGVSSAEVNEAREQRAAGEFHGYSLSFDFCVPSAEG
jgi:hypothetical protein